ncbi:MAG: exonuclease domain-containing protein [Shinella zoogloeoides]|uniref:exonuclease domain-containing protein n=1 Tax=Shinella zoogloeoides TaxID=352475 RepID=UPI003C78E22B
MTIVVVALNLTDSDEASVSRVVEIGCVEMENIFPTGRIFHSYFNPKKSADFNKVYSSGITDEFFSRHRSFEEASQEIFEFISDSKIVFHNAPFSVRSLNDEMKRCGLMPFPQDRIIDALSMARESFPFIGNSFDELRAALGIPDRGRKRRNAVENAEILAEIFQELMRRNNKNSRLVEQVALVLRNSNISNLSASGAADLIDSAAEIFLNGSRLNDLPDEIFVFREISVIFRRLAENTKEKNILGKDDAERLRQEIIDLRMIIDRLVQSTLKCGKSSAFDVFLENFCGALGKSSALVVLGAAGYFLSTYAPKSLNAFTEVLLKVYRETSS